MVQILFKDLRYTFAGHEKAARFYENPARYQNVELPVKMPAQKDSVNLYNLQKKDDSITFME